MSAINRSMDCPNCEGDANIRDGYDGFDCPNCGLEVEIYPTDDEVRNPQMKEKFLGDIQFSGREIDGLGRSDTPWPAEYRIGSTHGRWYGPYTVSTNKNYLHDRKTQECGGVCVECGEPYYLAKAATRTIHNGPGIEKDVVVVVHSFEGRDYCQVDRDLWEHERKKL